MIEIYSGGTKSRSRLLMYIAVCVMVLITIPISSAAQDSAVQDRSTDLEIYAAALEQVYIVPETKIILIADSTTSWWDFAGREPGLGIFSDLIRGLPSELVTSFAAANSSPSVIHDLPNVGVRLEIYDRSAEELEDVTDPTHPFPAQYPNATGILELTQPGLSSDGEQALLHVVFSCGPRCGGGKLIYLVKEKGCWMVKQAETTWTF